jgi:hypothetical protein
MHTLFTLWAFRHIGRSRWQKLEGLRKIEFNQEDVNDKLEGELSNAVKMRSCTRLTYEVLACKARSTQIPVAVINPSTRHVVRTACPDTDPARCARPTNGHPHCPAA